MRKALTLLLVLPAILYSCTNSTEKNLKPTVVVSIAPQKYFVDRIADNTIHVEFMVPAGSSPEVYEPTASQLKSLSQASAYFSLGLLEFEMSMLNNIHEQNPNILIVNHAKDLNLISGECDSHHDHGHSHSHGSDPHVWLSPIEVKTMVRTITTVLSQKFPEHKITFEANFAHLIEDIDTLNIHIKRSLQGIENNKIYIYHPALTYFARDYGLKQISLEQDGKAPSMKHMQAILQSAREQGAKTIFIQKEFDTNNAKAAASDIGGIIEVIDPLREDWLENMYHMSNLVSKALK
ncbi:MAG: zinc ABC transporter substrate-binding protein [Bacteroidales bacterium]